MRESPFEMDIDQRVKREEEEEKLHLLFSQSTSDASDKGETRRGRSSPLLPLPRHSKGKGESLSNARNTHSLEKEGGREGWKEGAAIPPFTNSERASIVRASGALHRLVVPPRKSS